MPAGSTDEADAKNKALPRFLAILDVQEAELQRAIANNLRAMQELRKPRAGRKAAGGEAPAAAAAGDSGASENLPVKATAEAASEAAVPPPSDALMEQLKALHQGLPQARRNTLYRCGAVAGAIAESGLRRMAQTARGLLTQHVHPSRWVSEEGGGDSVDVVDGFLELPQVQGRLARALLVSERCFILDGIVQVFIWVGRLSPPEHRIAARKLALVSQAFQTAWRMPSGGCSRRPLHGGTRVGRRGGGGLQHLYQLVPRPAWAKVSRVLEHTETEQFKRFFDDWTTIVQVRCCLVVGRVGPERMRAQVAMVVILAGGTGTGRLQRAERRSGPYGVEPCGREGKARFSVDGAADRGKHGTASFARPPRHRSQRSVRPTQRSSWTQTCGPFTNPPRRP